jgi:glycosyltransferase involved in cell wall biosynthesis
MVAVGEWRDLIVCGCAGSVACLPRPGVLFVSYSSVLGGAERILLDVVQGLDGAPAIACPPGPLADAARASVPVLLPLEPRALELRAGMRVRTAAAIAIAGLARELRRVVRRTRPAIVVAWNMRALLACAPALAGLRDSPRLVFAHNDLLPGPVIARAIRAAAGQADLIVCLSHAIARDLGAAGAVEVVQAGVDLARFSPGGEPAPDAPVLVLGAIEPWKRPDLALEIAARAPGLRMRLAGEPIGAAGAALLADLRRRAAAPELRGRVELSGRVDDPVVALREATALLHCADREPYGRALVEALACGVPVVAPAAAGPVEIVGPEGRLFVPGDASAAAAALSEILEPSRRRALSAAARRRAEERFDVVQTRRRWGELLSRM